MHAQIVTPRLDVTWTRCHISSHSKGMFNNLYNCLAEVLLNLAGATKLADNAAALDYDHELASQGH